MRRTDEYERRGCCAEQITFLQVGSIESGHCANVLSKVRGGYGIGIFVTEFKS